MNIDLLVSVLFQKLFIEHLHYVNTALGSNDTVETSIVLLPSELSIYWHKKKP